MTQLELLAAKVRGADSNQRGAEIIAKWYADQTQYAVRLATSSANDVRSSEAFTGGLRDQLAKNFDGVAELLTLSNKELE